jgi:uncharacterized protein YecE (DUF72 family)
MQDALFPDQQPFPEARPHKGSVPPDKTAAPKQGPRTRAALTVQASPVDPDQFALAQALPALLRLGTSSWTYPGWDGKVWDGAYSEPMLSKHGLAAYAQHPLLRAVSVDRGFYRALTPGQFAHYAAQVPDDFRFVVKAPSAVADAMVRNEKGQSLQPNPLFLSPRLALQEFVHPALEGLRHKVGALVFQLSPLPPELLRQMPRVLDSLHTMLRALPSLQPTAPDGVMAIEVRDPAFLTPDFAALLRDVGATSCLCLHPKMPPIAAQLPVLRSLWPGPLVCRWNLNRRHGAFGYEDARDQYAPFDRMQDPDLDTRAMLARVIKGTTHAGQRAYVTISNKAEGCAPLSVLALAQAVQAGN